MSFGKNMEKKTECLGKRKSIALNYRSMEVCYPQLTTDMKMAGPTHKIMSKPHLETKSSSPNNQQLFKCCTSGTRFERDLNVWEDEVDRFGNFVTTKKMKANELIPFVEKTLSQIKNELKQNNSEFSYVLHDQTFMCEIATGDEMVSQFCITLYSYKDEKCLLDVQELSGEHFTFSGVLENFKRNLKSQGIIDFPSIRPELLNSYGLDLDIGFDAFN